MPRRCQQQARLLQEPTRNRPRGHQCSRTPCREHARRPERSPTLACLPRGNGTPALSRVRTPPLRRRPAAGLIVVFGSFSLSVAASSQPAQPPASPALLHPLAPTGALRSREAAPPALASVRLPLTPSLLRPPLPREAVPAWASPAALSPHAAPSSPPLSA